MTVQRWCWCCLVCLLVGLSGCAWEERVVYDGWAVFRNQMGDRQRPARRRPGRADQADAGQFSGWSILLETFEGAGRYRRANALMHSLIRDADMTGLWLQDAGGKVYVYRGRYDQQSDVSAQADLAQTRKAQIDGVQPYEDAELVSVGTRGVRDTHPMDLRFYSGYFSLQIGFYDADYGPDYRKAAERAAKELRNDGVNAYYYHGPYRSMVTVELFTDADFEQDGAVQVYGPRIEALRQQYKYNLANGRTLIETFTDGKKKESRAQPSFLVRVP